MALEYTGRPYIPAMGKHWSLPLYDPFTRLIGMNRVRRRLLDLAALRAGDRVLDVGCGTGSLAVLVKRTTPDVWVAALDPDPKALARARRKADRAGVNVQLDIGYADALPYPDASFDRVFSSFMFHHLQADEKLRMLREVRRVLTARGRLELVDFAGPDAGTPGTLAGLLHSHRLMKDNAAARVLALMSAAGFARASRVGRGALLVGQIAYYQATAGAAVT